MYINWKCIAEFSFPLSALKMKLFNHKLFSFNQNSYQIHFVSIWYWWLFDNIIPHIEQYSLFEVFPTEKWKLLANQENQNEKRFRKYEKKIKINLIEIRWNRSNFNASNASFIFNWKSAENKYTIKCSASSFVLSTFNIIITQAIKTIVKWSIRYIYCVYKTVFMWYCSYKTLQHQQQQQP